MAQSGLARLTGGQKVAGSNPVAPTLKPRFSERGFSFSWLPSPSSVNVSLYFLIRLNQKLTNYFD